MKGKNLFTVFLFFFFAITIMSCHDDHDDDVEITNFQLDKHYYEVGLKIGNNINILNGSGDISVAIEDEAILSAIYSGRLYADQLCGVVHLMGKSKGETTVTITDNVTHEKEIVNVKVTDSYLSYCIQSSNHPSLEEDVVVFLLNNSSQDFYAFQTDYMHHALYTTPCGVGTYKFTVEKVTKEGNDEYIPYLTLNYTSDEKGNFIIAEILPTDHKFNILGSSQTAYGLLEAWLGVDWGNMIEHFTRTSYMPNPTLKLEDTEMGYTVLGHLNLEDKIPEKIIE